MKCLKRRHYFVFIYVIPLLIGLLQVDYKNKSVSPFDTHPINMWIFFTGSQLHVSIVWDYLLRRNCEIIIGHVFNLANFNFPPSLSWLALFRLMDHFAYYGHHARLKHSTVKSTSLAHEIFN
ncbi:hypothetical protein Q3G72_011179 [Acer saccharum]|nr:hypothetical protein Q3G72_011179 [Acer saccharum]